MRVLITGGRGMVGRNILEHPGLADWTIAAPARAELDLADYTAVEAYVAAFNPDMIVHAAGKVGGIQANINNPVEFLVSNLDIGRNVIMVAHATGVKRLLNLGSSCIYPREAPNPLREEQLLTGPLEPTNEGYALAKIAAMKLCEYINRQHPDFSYKTMIPCNLYGRHDHYEGIGSHLIPAVIRKIHDAKVAGDAIVELWGDGSARREFMYAGDLADAIVRGVADFDALPYIMNVGLGHDYSVLDYYKAIAEVVGWSGTFTFDLTKPTGMKQKLVDVSRQAGWGWQAPTSLHDGIARSYAFFLSEPLQ